MIRIRETTRTLPFHRPVPLTDLPLPYHRDHLFPYPSYADTEAGPIPRGFRMVVLENDALFDIGADAVGTVLPGANIAVKLGRLAARKVMK